MEAAPGEYLTSDDETVKVPVLLRRPELFPRVKAEMKTYKWNDSDFLLATFPKTGTHFIWEIMTMLLNGSADYITTSKLAVMIDQIPLSDGLKIFPSPRVLNTHYRTDVLPPEFRRGKTVVVARNPKDTCVSLFHFMQGSKDARFKDMKFEEFVHIFLHDKNQAYGPYLNYIEYMWSRRDDSNVLPVLYEDFILDPVETIQKVNEFMGTDRSPELIQQIADATSFDKMKKAKTSADASEEMFALMKDQTREEVAVRLKHVVKRTYRKGGVGGWKNHFTVAINEMFDEFLATWTGGKDIDFKY